MHIEKTELVPRADGNHKKWIFGTCLSTEDKPMDVAFGSRLMEIDTAIMYHFNENTSQWLPWRRD